jgi:3',5'-cyclic AMP phosphodiesterase CpdA
VLILAGDVTDALGLLDWTLGTLARKFRQVLFVPGNHELWVIRDEQPKNSLQKFHEVRAVVERAGASMERFEEGEVTIVPLLSWYDYSFGEPTDDLRQAWMDFRACRWPAGYTEREISAYFAGFNEHQAIPAKGTVITFSHFLPRIDVMPRGIPGSGRALYPVLGAARFDEQLRRLGSRLHVYGHSHVNRQVTIDGVSYINNAFGYPNETWIASKRLVSIHEC